MTDTARDLLPALAAADALVAALPPVPHWSATPDDYKTWTDQRDQATAAVTAALAEHRALICAKCDGRGRVQWQRAGRICFQCKGDGFTWNPKPSHPHCTVDASCEDGHHTYSWPCDYAPGTGRLAGRDAS